MCGSSAPMLYSPDQMNPATASTAMTDSPTRMSSVLRFTNAMVVVSLEPDTDARDEAGVLDIVRSEEHTSELQSLMRISYSVFCLTKTITHVHIKHNIV